MRKASKLFTEVYKYYVDKKVELNRIALSIEGCLPLPFKYYEPLGNGRFMAGNILYLYHLYIENKSKQASIIKRNCASRQKSVCTVCGIDLRDHYGKEGVNLLEYHYSESVTKYGNGMAVLPGKFIAICPTCHKLAHTNHNLFILQDLKKAIDGGLLSV